MFKLTSRQAALKEQEIVNIATFSCDKTSIVLLIGLWYAWHVHHFMTVQSMDASQRIDDTDSVTNNFLVSMQGNNTKHENRDGSYSNAGD